MHRFINGTVVLAATFTGLVLANSVLAVPRLDESSASLRARLKRYKGEREASLAADYESQMSVIPFTDHETNDLEGPQQIFFDFCLWARDQVSRERKRGINRVAVGAFRFLFRGVEDVVLRVLETQREAVDKLSDQMLDPDKPVKMPKKFQVPEWIIAKGQRRIQDENQLPAPLVALVTVVGAMGASLMIELHQRLVSLVAGLGENFSRSLNETCAQFESMDLILRTKFEDVQKELADDDLEIAKLKYTQLNCKTPRRVTLMNGMCKFVRMSRELVQVIPELNHQS